MNVNQQDVRVENLSYWNLQQRDLWEKITSQQPFERENITKFLMFAHVFRMFYLKHGRFLTLRDLR